MLVLVEGSPSLALNSQSSRAVILATLASETVHAWAISGCHSSSVSYPVSAFLREGEVLHSSQNHQT